MSSTTIDVDLMERVVALLPADRLADVLLLLDNSDADPLAFEAATLAGLEAIDWETQRAQVGALINQLLPLETLVPDIYAEWRPVVHDAIAYAGSHLSPARLAPKLVEQLLMPAETPLAKRVSAMIARVPSLQKVGQIVARYPHLEPAFRQELIQLENSIHDVTPASVQAAITADLGPLLARYRVKVAPDLLAEASVSAAVRFSWLNPSNGRRELGIFKVLKPYIQEYFGEDLAILEGLAAFFEVHRARYDLPDVNLPQVFADLHDLLVQEVQLPEEQLKLLQAYGQYASLPGVRVPRLIPELSTAAITAMSDEGGVKVTAAYAGIGSRRRNTAQHLVEALIAHPLFLPDDTILIHADPHAGNLFVDEQTGDLLLFDWALAQRVSRTERRELVRLLLGVALRDVELIMAAMNGLVVAPDQDAGGQEQAVRAYVRSFLGQFPPLGIGGLQDATRLITELMAAGVRFPPFLLIFRKLLFTLEGVLEDVSPGLHLDAVVLGYVRNRLLCLACDRAARGAGASFALPLQSADWGEVAASACLYYPRLWGNYLAVQ